MCATNRLYSIYFLYLFKSFITLGQSTLTSILILFPTIDVYILQGLWRYPIQEIERAGSFSAHLTRSLMLLMHMLLRKEEVNMLLYLYTQLSKVPDSGR